ncbi:hypothetical protein DICPUDRAFT_42606 [Dictyostelium purpureum]|uniref:HTTM domain-containing protein n=1 Tax=Dictyostelium purpureum TaxID=5786 RepID=F1A2F6_DICPU|nr:uncharacterized protein DICPUDRAFT_42606 [Dictyostelium purpureum]EGC29620.1 hypothetical protein DICPUDRAFT_42606 [Dictyostelium purpureum]|eukprot:XP_003293853.1 hypothetical protein DICPUDRAFT_42606 [Dictyostelium purpureum]
MYSIDCWLEIPRSSNYWFMDSQETSFINMSHFGVSFDQFIKSTFNVNSVVSQESFLFSVILSGFISLRCAFNINIQVFEPLLLALFKGYLVLSSQTDNYQHHYLLVLVLIVLSSINWNKFKGISNKTLVSCWQVKLLLIQLSLVYFWTSVAKFHWSWINGDVLPRMVGPEFKEMFNHYFEIITSILGIEYINNSSMAILSCLTIVSELFLVVSLHIPSLSILTFIIGVTMHTFMGSSGLRIGTFSYFMVIIYTLTLPHYFKKFNNSNNNNNNNNNKTIKNNQKTNKLNIFKKIIIDTLKVGTIGLLSIIFLLYNFIDPLFTQHFKYPLLAILVIIIIQTCYNNYIDSTSNNIKKQIFYLFSIGLIVSSLIQASDQFRLLYIEHGAMAIRLNSLDESIKSYLIAEEISDRVESKLFRFRAQQSNDFEFIGDLGLFLETKKNYSKALELYEKYNKIYPDILKIQIGMIRTYHSIDELDQKEKKSKICSIIPKTIEYANKLTSETCINQDCARNQNHARYVLNLIKQINNQFYSC